MKLLDKIQLKGLLFLLSDRIKKRKEAIKSSKVDPKIALN